MDITNFEKIKNLMIRIMQKAYKEMHPNFIQKRGVFMSTLKD
jgi:hypothetical protein